MVPAHRAAMMPISHDSIGSFEGAGTAVVLREKSQAAISCQPACNKLPTEMQLRKINSNIGSNSISRTS